MNQVIAILCSLVASLGLQPSHVTDQESKKASPGERVRQAAEDRPLDESVPKNATAEELLRALRRDGPTGEVVPPASATNGARRDAPSLLVPEGATAVDRTGSLRRDGRWWVFVEAGPEAQPPIRLLPNANLEVMVRTTEGTDLPVNFVVSGELTVFEDHNYLIVRLARRLLKTTREEGGPSADARADETVTGDDGSVVPSTRPGDTQVDDPSKAGTPVEDVLAALQRQAPAETAMPVLAAPTDESSARSASIPLGVMPDGAILVHRPGRMIRQGDWWSFSFESDRPEHPEPPMKLLPCRNVELMLRASERGNVGLVFLVSGEVTFFAGENYLLPKLAMRRIGSNNTRK